MLQVQLGVQTGKSKHTELGRRNQINTTNGPEWISNTDKEEKTPRPGTIGNKSGRKLRGLRIRIDLRSTRSSGLATVRQIQNTLKDNWEKGGRNSETRWTLPHPWHRRTWIFRPTWRKYAWVEVVTALTHTWLRLCSYWVLAWGPAHRIVLVHDTVGLIQHTVLK